MKKILALKTEPIFANTMFPPPCFAMLTCLKLFGVAGTQGPLYVASLLASQDDSLKEALFVCLAEFLLSAQNSLSPALFPVLSATADAIRQHYCPPADEQSLDLAFYQAGQNPLLSSWQLDEEGQIKVLDLRDSSQSLSFVDTTTTPNITLTQALEQAVDRGYAILANQTKALVDADYDRSSEAWSTIVEERQELKPILDALEKRETPLFLKRCLIRYLGLHLQYYYREDIFRTLVSLAQNSELKDTILVVCNKTASTVALRINGDPRTYLENFQYPGDEQATQRQEAASLLVAQLKSLDHLEERKNAELKKVIEDIQTRYELTEETTA
jgi:hypothetical protein